MNKGQTVDIQIHPDTIKNLNAAKAARSDPELSKAVTNIITRMVTRLLRKFCLLNASFQMDIAASTSCTIYGFITCSLMSQPKKYFGGPPTIDS
jgi:hypothetical protein